MLDPDCSCLQQILPRIIYAERKHYLESSVSQECVEYSPVSISQRHAIASALPGLGPGFRPGLSPGLGLGLGAG